MKERTCCVTGHRNIPKGKEKYVQEELEQAVKKAVNDGYTRFLSGFAEGVDLTFAAIVAEQKKRRPNLCLEAAIPHRGRLKCKNPLFQSLLCDCDEVTVLCENYTPSCFFVRNRYLVSESGLVIAVYDDREKGGTAYTVGYARSSGKEVRVIKI